MVTALTPLRATCHPALNSTRHVTAQAAAVLLQSCGLPEAWAGQDAWRILDTHFDQGFYFLNTWLAWQKDPQRPRLLHYVSLTSAPPQLTELLACADIFPELQPLSQELATQWFGLLPGFHRLMLDGGRVLLTLCVGDLTAQLRQQQFVADSVYLNPASPACTDASPWDIWTVKALARCCRRGTYLSTTTDSPGLLADLTQCGFEMQSGSPDPTKGSLSGQFNPRWTIKNTRDASISPAIKVGTCAVTGVLERRVDGSPGLPDNWPAPGQDWSHAAHLKPEDTAWNHGIAAAEPAIWHTQAAWLKPAQLIKAWLALPGITFQGGAKVASIRPSGEEWELLDAQEQVLCRANRVVIANAAGAVALLESLQTTLPALGIRLNQLPSMHGLRGLLSWAMHQAPPDPAFPPFPVNGSGSVVPIVPVEGGTAWFIGSSYEPDSQPALPDETNHAANLARLSALLPRLSHVLEHQFAEGSIIAWKQTRCVTYDRLPVVGPLYKSDNPGL